MPIESAAFQQFVFDYEILDPDELMDRWLRFRLEGPGRAIFQKDSGLVDARKSNAVHVALARARGAAVLKNPTREQVAYYATSNLEEFSPERSPVCGEVASAYPIEPFKILRPAITDRTFEKTFHA